MLQEWKTLAFEMEDDCSWSKTFVGLYGKRGNVIANFECHIEKPLNILFCNTNTEGLENQMHTKVAKQCYDQT